MKIYLVLTDDKSEKFWEIEQTGNSHTVRYGKVGAKGTSKTKEFESAEKAETDANKLINAKQKKGYVETQSPEEIKAAQMPKPQVISFDELKKLHEIKINDNNISHVLYYGEDLELTEDLTQNWAVIEALNLTNKNLLIYINGNLSVDGNISFNTTYPCLYVNGNTKCQELINNNATINITGDANIKYLLHGIDNSGHIKINGITYVPYILNNNHKIKVTTAKGTSAICYAGNNKLMKYDFVEADFPQFLKKTVMQEDKLQLDKLIKLIRKGSYPFKKTDKTDEDILQKKLLDLVFESDSVTELDLSYKSLDKFPPLVLQLTNLKVLKLNRQYYFNVIPEKIINLQNLEELHLKVFQGTSLPKAIEKLPKLRVLNLESAKSNLTKDIGELIHLEQLYCSFNPKHFPESINKLQHLTYLHLGCRLVNKVLANFPEQICELTQLKYLTLDDLHFSNLPNCFNQLINLERFICKRSFQTVQEIPQFTELKHLKQVELRDAFGNPACIQAFFNNPSITNLSIEDDELESHHLDGIEKLTNLEYITIKSEKITTLPEGIYKLKHLKHIDVERTKLTYESLAKLAATYPHACFKVYPVEHPDKTTRKVFQRLMDVHEKFWELHRKLEKDRAQEDLDKLYQLADYFFNELASENAPKYEFFTKPGSLKSYLIINIGNLVAWHTSLIEKDKSRLEESLSYIKLAMNEFIPKDIIIRDNDFVLDSYVRVLLKLGRKDEAYDVVYEVLNRRPNFYDFKDFKQNKGYLNWIKKNK